MTLAFVLVQPHCATLFFFGNIRKLGATSQINAVMLVEINGAVWCGGTRFFDLSRKQLQLNVVGQWLVKMWIPSIPHDVAVAISIDSKRTIPGIGLKQICDRNPEIAGSMGRWWLKKIFTIFPCKDQSICQWYVDFSVICFTLDLSLLHVHWIHQFAVGWNMPMMV